MYSQTEDVSVFQPIVNGAVVDEKMATLLITEILNGSILRKNFISGVSAIVAVPCGLNYEQLVTIKKVIKSSGINKVTLVTNAVCVRELLDLEEDQAVAVVDIGKTITDITVLNGFEIFKGRTYQIGGQDMDKSISTYIQDNHNLEVLDITSEEIKNEVASLYEKDLYQTKFIGIDTDNHFRKDEISASEVRLAIVNVYDLILNSCQEMIDSLDKNTAASVYKNGIVFVGGGALVSGLYEYVNKKLKANIIVMENPADSVLLGAAKMLTSNKKLKAIDV